MTLTTQVHLHVPLFFCEPRQLYLHIVTATTVPHTRGSGRDLEDLLAAEDGKVPREPQTFLLAESPVIPVPTPRPERSFVCLGRLILKNAAGGAYAHLCPTSSGVHLRPTSDLRMNVEAPPKAMLSS